MISWIDEIKEDHRLQIYHKLEETGTMVTLDLYNGLEIVLLVDIFRRCDLENSNEPQEYFYQVTLRDKRTKQIVEKTQFFFTRYNEHLIYENVVNYVRKIECPKLYN
jgi:hypothetical protein